MTDVADDVEQHCAATNTIMQAVAEPIRDHWVLVNDQKYPRQAGGSTSQDPGNDRPGRHRGDVPQQSKEHHAHQTDKPVRR